MVGSLARIKFSVSILSFTKISFKNKPKASLPIFPAKADFPPNLLQEMAAFAGAPPAFLMKFTDSTKEESISVEIQSMRSSPMQKGFHIV